MTQRLYEISSKITPAFLELKKKTEQQTDRHAHSAENISTRRTKRKRVRGGGGKNY